MRLVSRKTDAAKSEITVTPTPKNAETPARPQMINDDDYQAAMVSWLIDLGKDFAVETLAEGVETNAQAMMLSGLGCDSAQGYFFGRPMPAEDVAEFIAQWTAGTATDVDGEASTPTSLDALALMYLKAAAA